MRLMRVELSLNFLRLRLKWFIWWTNLHVHCSWSVNDDPFSKTTIIAFLWWLVVLMNFWNIISNQLMSAAILLNRIEQEERRWEVTRLNPDRTKWYGRILDRNSFVLDQWCLMASVSSNSTATNTSCCSWSCAVNLEIYHVSWRILDYLLETFALTNTQGRWKRHPLILHRLLLSSIWSVVSFPARLFIIGVRNRRLVWVHSMCYINYSRN